MLALTLLAAGPARAAAPDAGLPAATPADMEVDEHVAQGHRLYLLGRYQEAIAEYRRAYELRANPEFLFQIAESYRQLGATEQALFYYDRYLAGDPGGPERATAEERVAEIESLRARPPASATPGLVGAPAPAAASKRPKPLWRRWWLWTAIGAVALAAGVTAALAARSETSVPNTYLGNKGFF